MISFDLKSGCHHIAIHLHHQAFLGFVWKLPGALSFGFKCLKPLEKCWKVNRVNIALFLNDGWLIDIDRNSCAV